MYKTSAFVSADSVCYSSNDCTKLHSVTVTDIKYEIFALLDS